MPSADESNRPVLTVKSGTAKSGNEPDEQMPARPAKLRIMQHYGFIDEYDRPRFWREGDIIGDPHEIALLIARKAPAETAQ